MSSEITRETIGELISQLDAARSAVFVCTVALDTGDDHTDLECQCGTTLRRASKELAALGARRAQRCGRSERGSDSGFTKRTVRVRISKNDDARTVHLPYSAAEALQALKRSN
jgi:hypothetical protein